MAAHLLNRAGFGGTPKEIQALADLGPEKAVSSLLDYESIPDSTLNPDWARPNPAGVVQFREALRNAKTPDDRKMLQQEKQRLIQQQMMELRGWWLQRMVHGPRPLQEKRWCCSGMVILQRASRKCAEPAVLHVAPERTIPAGWPRATGNICFVRGRQGSGDAGVAGPGPQSRGKDHPLNENFAREVMELFALGEGHYTEKDITEGARALTGWSLDNEQEQFILSGRASTMMA